jgi:hypothetical protein
MDKVYGPDMDKSEWIKLEFFMDLDNRDLDSNYSRQFATFKDGWPEDWITCIIVDILP